MQHCKHADNVRLPDDANFSLKLSHGTVTESLGVYLCVCAFVHTSCADITVIIYSCKCREKLSFPFTLRSCTAKKSLRKSKLFPSVNIYLIPILKLKGDLV